MTHPSNRSHGPRQALLAVAVALLSTACGGARSGSAGVASTVASSAALPTDTALTVAFSSATSSSGTLLCTPSQAQTDDCAGLAAGDACTLAVFTGHTTTVHDLATWGGTTVDVAGTCRTTIDGTGVACAPNPPAPPAELVSACSTLALGGGCTVTEAFGDTRSGVCVTARDGSTLVCGRVHPPPQVAIDACTGLAAGDPCTPAISPEHTLATGNGSTSTPTRSGICSLGPAGTGPLACTPSHELLPEGAEACAGLADGAACALGRGPFAVSGTCATPAGSMTAICVVACGTLGGRFECRGGDRDHHHGPFWPPGPPGPSGPTGPMVPMRP